MMDNIRATVEGEWCTLKRVKGLCMDNIVRLGPVVYIGAIKTAANQGHYNTNGEVVGVQQSDNSKWPKCSITYIHNQNNAIQTYTY